MLRLQPSAITLTRRELDDFDVKMEIRRRMRLRQPDHEPAYITCTSADSSFPRIHIGAERQLSYGSSDLSTDELGSPEYEVSRSTSGYSGFYQALYGEEPSMDRATSSMLSSRPRTSNSRRDSVLSYEQSSDSDKSTNPNWISYEDATDQNTFGPDDEASSPQNERSLLDGSSSGVESASGWKSAAAGHSHSSIRSYNRLRRHHARSQSEPIERPLPYNEFSSPLLEIEENLIDLRASIRLQGAPASASRSTAVNLRKSSADSTDYLGPPMVSHHVRHWSLPPALHRTAPANAPLIRRRPVASVRKGRSVSDGSAIREAKRNSSSPLEEIIEDATALGKSQWVTELPHRSIGASSATGVMRFPDFEDESEDELSSVPALTLTEHVDEHGSARARNSGVSRVVHSARSYHSPLPSPRRRVAVRADGPRQMGMARQRIASEFALASGGRPSSAGGSGGCVQAVRRRPLPSPDQENQDVLVDFMGERDAYLERQRPTVGSSLLDRTPPAAGRLDRFLR